MRHLVQMLRYSRRHATFAAAVLVAALAAGVSCPGTAIAVSPSPQLLGRMAHSAALRQDVTTRLQRAHDAGVDVPPIRTYGPGSRVVPNTGGIAVAGSAAMAPALQAAAAANGTSSNGADAVVGERGEVTADGPSTALVLAKRDAHVRSEFNKRFPYIRTSRVSMGSSAAGRSSGASAGARADLGGSRIGGRRSLPGSSTRR